MTKYITACAIGVSIGAIGASYIYQQKSNEIEFVKGETIVDSIMIPQPYAVATPSKPTYIYKTDTVTVLNKETVYITSIVDTAAILSEFIKSKRYKETLFDSLNFGKLDVTAHVQYNSLQSLGYSFTKYNTVKKNRLYTPFVQSLFGSHPAFVGIGGGILVEKVGIGGAIMRDKSMMFNLFYVFD